MDLVELLAVVDQQQGLDYFVVEVAAVVVVVEL